MIHERIAQGVYVRNITAEMGVHPRTVSRALRRGRAPPGQRPTARKSKLTPTSRWWIGCLEKECGTGR